MELDLSTNKLFNADTITFNKRLNFIYGKNGTGKSTITKLMLKECGTDDISVFAFQGFDSVIGENALLNAIVLGETNKSIEAQITEKENERQRLKEEEEEKNKIINPGIEGSKGQKKKDIEEKLKKLYEKKERFFSDLARQITQLYDGKIVENPRAYNKSTVKSEMNGAQILDNSEVERLKKIIYTQKTEKIPLISALSYELAQKFVEDVNNLLVTAIQERKILQIESNLEREYLEIGIELHKPDDHCKFCGNIITDKRYRDIKSYFDADEVKTFKAKNEALKNIIDRQILKLNSLVDIDFSNVQDTFKEQIGGDIQVLNGNIAQAIRDYVFLNQALESNNPFESRNPVSLGEPVNINQPITSLNTKIDEFNKLLDDLNNRQSVARLKLRKHHIEMELLTDEYKSIIQEISDQESELGYLEQDIREVQKQIKRIRSDISNLEESIKKLIAKTKSTELLVQNVNQKLEGIASFKLTLQSSNQREVEYYEIQNNEGVVRPITQLSTGEKNLIAFLYFLESLNSLECRDKAKLIVFDDPMNSNDDTVQYFMLEELNKLLKKVSKASKDIFVLLTHNVFFYQGLIHDLVNLRDSEAKPYEDYNFYKLLKVDDVVQINLVKNKADDFLNSYDGLWYELAFLYKQDKPRLMLNPIRRIIETFVLFNGIEGFYSNSKDAKRLFNVNSHGNIVFDVDIIGISREALIEKMKKLFIDNNYGQHFEKHWKYWKEHCKVELT